MLASRCCFCKEEEELTDNFLIHRGMASVCGPHYLHYLVPLGVQGAVSSFHFTFSCVGAPCISLYPPWAFLILYLLLFSPLFFLFLFPIS